MAIAPKQSSFRRVVTTRHDAGPSRVLIDGPARNLGTLHEFWMTDDIVGSLAKGCEDIDGDPVSRPFKIAPDEGGSVFRFVEIEPESKFSDMTADQRRATVQHAFSAVGSVDALVDTSRHPAMHLTRTIDYIIVLRGNLTMILEDGEVDLKPLDVVVQRGTNHAWVNKGSEPALLAAVLIGTN